MTKAVNLYSVVFLAFLSTAQPAWAGPTSQPAEITFLDPDSTPAVGATVVLLPARNVRLYRFTGNLDPAPYPDTTQYHLPVNGRLQFLGVDARGGMLAFDEKGYAEVAGSMAARGGVISLHRWGRIEGNLMIGSRVGAGETVGVQLSHRRYASGDWQTLVSLEARTDAAGHFAFDRVPPGDWSVSRAIIDDGAVSVTQAKDVSLVEGRTVHVAIGGMGRPLGGRLNIPPILAGKSGLHYDCQVTHFEKPPQRPWPDDVRNGTPEQRRTWDKVFLQTDAGRAWRSAVNAALGAARVYPAELNADGTFRVEDVAAGTYNLEVYVFVGEPLASTPTALASGTLAFEVPAMPTGREDEPLHLAAVALHLDHPTAWVGEIAPDFDLGTLDGKQVHLAGLRGKFVVLDTWGVYCTPSVERTLELRDALRGFSGPKEFVVIGLNCDEEVQRPLAFVQRHRINWPQVWVGGSTGQTTRESYSTDGSGIWLVGPDGTVIAKDIEPAKVRSAVAAAMR